ncbi:hypothetical protein [Sulfurovum sp.]|uniref:hypothetical protein n=1 Tax=Sulfurovum sp. TaxID=1969726 RepID=UPI002867D6B2|nr:hypothetical protein [Sulfurovum sp.]
MSKIVSSILSNMPSIIVRVLKYLLYIFLFVSIVFILVLSTRTGNKIGYLYLSDKLSRKSNLDIKALSVNLYTYPQVSASLLIEDQYRLDVEGKIQDFEQLDLNYTITSSTIQSDYSTINDEVDIRGVITGPFRNFFISGNGKILDGTIVFEGLRKRRSVDNIDIGLADFNTSKFLELLGEEELFKGKSNVHISFDTIGKHGKKGTIKYDLKDKDFSGIPVEAQANVNIIDDNQTFSIQLSTPTSTIDINQGAYNRKTKVGSAQYVLDIKELADWEEVLEVEATGPFLSSGNIMYDQKIKVQGMSESFGGILDIFYEKKKFNFHLNDVPFHELMNRLTYSPLLDAKMQGEITYDQREKEMHTKVKLKDVKLIQKDLVKVIKEKFDYDVNNEVFKNSSFEATYKDKVLSSKVTIANDINYLIFKDTEVNSLERSIDTEIDFKIDEHFIAGQLYIRNDGHENHTLDSFVRFDGLVEQFYRVKLNGALSDEWTNMDYALSSARCPSHICTIVDDINISGHLYGPFSRLLIRGEGKALEGHIQFDGIKNDETFRDVKIEMKDIHAKKLYTLLGAPTLPHGIATVNLNLEFLNGEHKKGTLDYTLRNGIYDTLPLDITTHVTIKDNLYKFTGDLNLNGSKAKFTKGVHDSDKDTTHAFYKLDIKDLTTLKPLFGHTYNGPFYAMGTIDYKDDFLIRGLSKSLGGLIDFLYKEDILYVDFKNTSLKDLLGLFSYPMLLDAKTNGSVNYHYKKDLLLVNTKLNNAKFLKSKDLDDIYKKSGIYLPDEIFDQSTLEFTYQNDIILGSLKLENRSGHIIVSNAKIDTDKKLVDAYFDINLQKRALTGKIYGPLDKPEVNLNMQKLIRHEMDKQLDSVVGQGNREMMDSMPMGEMPKDVASGMGGAFMGIFF